MIAGDFSACPADIAGLTVAQKALFTNNKIDPKKYDPSSLKLANKLPGASGCGLLPVGLATQVNEGQYVARGDYQTSAKNTIFGRYLRTTYFRPPSLTITPANILSSTQGGLSDADQTWTAGDTYLFSSSMVNQFRASVLRQGIHRFDFRLCRFLRFGSAGILRIRAASEHVHSYRQLHSRPRHGR